MAESAAIVRLATELEAQRAALAWHLSPFPFALFNPALGQFDSWHHGHMRPFMVPLAASGRTGVPPAPPQLSHVVHVAGLPHDIDEGFLAALFGGGQHNVRAVRILSRAHSTTDDKPTVRALVEMVDEEGARAAERHSGQYIGWPPRHRLEVRSATPPANTSLQALLRHPAALEPVRNVMRATVLR